MDPSNISILQYNTHKSRNIVMVPLFKNDNILNINTTALQEPWKNTWDQTTYHLRKDAYYLVYFESDKTQVCFFVYKRIKQSSWAFTVHSPDIINLYIKFFEKQIHIYNIYTLINTEEISTSISTLE